MSSTFERARLALAVVLAGALLLASGLTLASWTPYVPPPIPPQDVADVKAGVSILQTARSPIVGAQVCDAIKGLLPNMFTTADGDAKMSAPSRKPVILCFKGSFDYGDALAAAKARKLVWRRGLGGEKVVVFAPNEATFMAFARANHMAVDAADLRRNSEFLDRLAAQGRSHRSGRGWRIDPGPTDEVLFGPYLDLPPGAYGLDMIFEPDEGVPCQALGQGLQVSAAVTWDARIKILAPNQPLVLKPLNRAGCRLGTHMRFTVPSPGVTKLETPIWEASPVPVKLTDYVLEPES